MDQERPDRPDHGIPQHRPDTKEPAEGSRDTVGATDDAGGTDNAGGITNRPLEREEREQSEVPPRGQRKDEARGDNEQPQDDASLNTKI